MKRSATKSSKTHSGTASRQAGQHFFGGVRGPGFFAPLQRSATSQGVVQAKLSVSKPTDPMEKEADRTADRVMRMVAPTPSAAPGPRVQRTVDERVHRLGIGVPTITADAHAAIRQATGGGQPLPAQVRTFMEPRLGADLGGVRVHTDAGAQGLSNQLSARAFTHRNHIFFGPGQCQPDSGEGRHLLAHELTHTIQQGATVQRDSLMRSPKVSTSAGPPAVQRFGLDSVVDYIADRAAYLPGFRMLTLMLGCDPITMRKVDRTATNFLRALIELLPGGSLITQALDNHGVIDKAASWVERKATTLGDIGGQIGAAVQGFLKSLTFTDIARPSAVWDRGRRIITDPVNRLVQFGMGAVTDLLTLVREAILRPLASLAQGTRGYDLLRAILGQDPITGEPVPRSADALIGGFMKLIGQEEVWQNIKRGNAVAPALAWFEQASSGLKAFALSIPRRVSQTLTSLTFADVITVAGAFRRLGGAFVDVVVEFGAWAGRQVLGLLEILFSVVAPGAVPYIAKVRTAFATIVRDPIRFVGNLVRAARLGFERFAANIVEHLKAALIKWITGPLGQAGVYIPTSFSLIEIVKLVLSVLGLTWQNIRTKLLKIIPAPVLTVLEKTATILVTLATQGPAAAWEQIKAELTELKDQLIGKVTEMIQFEVVKAAVKKLAGMLNPAGALIQAIVAIYDTVTFFIDKIQQIGAVVGTFIDSISSIAAGQVENAAKKVEQTMANTLTMVIAFLAKFAGLGGIPEKLVAIVKKIRQPIDKGLDKIVDWLGKMLQKLVNKAKAGVKKLLQWWKKKVPISGADEPHTLTFQGERKSARLVVRSQPEKPSTFLKREHQRSGKPDVLLETPMKMTTASEQTISDLQKELSEIDENGSPTLSGQKRKAADANSEKLNAELDRLAKTIGKALAKWYGKKEDFVGEFTIERSSFSSVSLRRKIGQEYKKMRQRLKLAKYENTRYSKDNDDGDPVYVADGVDRRHVISSQDVIAHYVGVLSKKTLSAAKLLLEQSGSVLEARVPVVRNKQQRLTAKRIVAAAAKRYRKFFGYVSNIFLGPASQNRSLQSDDDRHHPEMTDARSFDNHVARVKRAWALDGSFREIPSKTT